VYRITDSGAEQVVRFLEPGDFLGETAVLADEPVDHFAEATENGEVCSIRRSALRELLAQQPDVAMRMLRTVSGRLQTAEELLSAVTGQSVEQRLAEHLLRRAAEEGSQAFRLQSSKKDLASFLGTTPETLSRRFTALQDAGLIRLGARQSVLILDGDGLRALLSLDPRG
jgi:CRP/FNR family transcriptional regulator